MVQRLEPDISASPKCQLPWAMMRVLLFSDYIHLQDVTQSVLLVVSFRGKLAALKLLMTHDHFHDVFIKLGEEWQLTDDIFKVLEEFTCRLSVIHSEICDVNEMRYELFRVKDGHVESEQLPTPPLPGLSLSTCCEGQLSGCHLASRTAGRSKSTKPNGLQRLVTGWRCRTSDKLDDRSTSSERGPGVPLL